LNIDLAGVFTPSVAGTIARYLALKDAHGLLLRSAA